MGSNFRFDDKGLRDFQKELEKAAAPSKVSLSELLDPDFMRRYTDFGSFEEMVQEGFGVTSAEEFLAIPDDQGEAHVVGRTRFQSWQQMQGKAGEELMARRLRNL
jgi:hypothetical protein